MSEKKKKLGNAFRLLRCNFLVSPCFDYNELAMATKIPDEARSRPIPKCEGVYPVQVQLVQPNEWGTTDENLRALRAHKFRSVRLAEFVGLIRDHYKKMKAFPLTYLPEVRADVIRDNTIYEYALVLDTRGQGNCEFSLQDTREHYAGTKQQWDLFWNFAVVEL